MPPSWDQRWQDDSPAADAASAARMHAEMILGKREAPSNMVQIPGCVTGCMAVANTGQCANNFDYLCLCDSVTYQQAVMQCWAVRCNATSYETALAYSTAACSALGAQLNPGINGATHNLTMGPITFSRAAANIQAVMSSICSFVLLCAIGLGILSCRNQARKQSFTTAATAGAWTATTGNTKSRVSRVPRSYFPGREEGQISTVDMGGSVDFSEMFKVAPPARRPVARKLGEPKFTNRLPTERSEEWEMGRVGGGADGADGDLGEGSSTRGSGSGSGKLSEVKEETDDETHRVIAKDHYESRSSIRFSLASSRKAVLGEYTAPSMESGSEARCGETHASTAPLNPREHADSTRSGSPDTPSTVYVRAEETPVPNTPGESADKAEPTTPTPAPAPSSTPSPGDSRTPTSPARPASPTSPTTPRPFASYHDKP